MEVLLQGRSAQKLYRSQATFAHERGVLGQLPPHPNIARILLEDRDALVITFERVRHGDLMRWLLQGRALSDERCAAGLLRGLAHCHRFYLAHCDIKPENILLNDDGEAVLCDFARAAFAPEPLQKKFHGTRAYAAPEALRGICCIANDLWALGMVFFCMVERAMPFDSDDAGGYVLDADAERWRSGFAAKLFPEVRALLVPEPTARPGASTVKARLDRTAA